MRIRGFDLTRAQLGWTCTVCYTVFTTGQCSAEEHAVMSGGKWLLTAMWNGWRAARKAAAKRQATPKQRKALGW